MSFHTWAFALFFLVFYIGYLPIRKTRCGTYWLLAASYLFYASWNPYFLILILFTTSVDYFVVLRMARSEKKRLWLLVSLVCNLGCLGFFKYNRFAIDNINAICGRFGLGYSISYPGVGLPVGISFFTFRSISYTIDAYRGRVEPETRFVRYAVFVSLFPQLLMGPIDRASHLLPQIRNVAERRITIQNLTDGLSIFCVGLFKKMVLADSLGLYVDKFYSAPAFADGSHLMVATFAFAWQIYFDFSGYTDMARGIAKTMGFDLMLNFNNPYLANGLGDFWRRWHISLSTWFKDYLYIPLGGNRKGTLRTYVNMSITMVVSGLWHGAAWTFVIWGALHALGRVVTREFERTAFYRDKVPNTIKQLAVFLFVCFAWIFFKAKTFGDAVLIVKKIFSGSMTDPRFPLFFAGLVLVVWAYQFVFESRFKRVLESRVVTVGLVFLMLLYMLFFATSTEQPFIYQQF
ncbi:MAG: MBOAT family protein [Planctomycetes bacterium]|nr:MBOAT family protein [Planctomycetota bacterium]